MPVFKLKIRNKKNFRNSALQWLNRGTSWLIQFRPGRWMEQLVKDWKDLKTRWFRSFRKLFNQTGIFTLPIFLTLKNEDPHFPWRSILKKVPKIKRPRRPDKIMKISEDSFRALRTILVQARGPWDGTDRKIGDESDEKILTWLKGVFYIGPEVVTLQADDSLNLLLLPCHLEQIATIPWEFPTHRIRP